MSPAKTKAIASVSSSLSSRALLVNISISQWAGRKLDKAATQTVMSQHGAEKSAGGYTKKLLPGAKELEHVAACATAIRKFFYDQTLPWMSDGSRIISAKNHLKFSAEIRKMTATFETAVREFETAYPRLQQTAQAALGNLYNPKEYPAPSEISGKFRAETNYMPLPDVKDFRVDVSDAEKKAFVAKMREVENAAMREVWERLHGVVKNAAEKLAAPDAIFRDSLLENVTELCALLPALNIADDAKLETMRRDVEKLVNSFSADSIRNDQDVRQDAAAKLKQAMDSMSAFV